MVITDVPATAVIVPVQAGEPVLTPVVITRPCGAKLSVKEMPVKVEKTPAGLLLVNVMVRSVTPLTCTVDGAKTFEIVGGSRGVMIAPAAASVLPPEIAPPAAMKLLPAPPPAPL